MRESGRTLGTMATVVAIMGAVFAAYFHLEAKFAPCSEVRAIRERLDYKIEADKFDRMQDRQDRLKEKYGSDPGKIQNSEARRQLEELNQAIPVQREKLMRMEIGK